MTALLIFIFILALTLCLGLAVDFALWKAWLFVVPSMWPTGPKGFTQPDYWVFVVATVLLSWLGSLFRSSTTTTVKTA